MAKYRHGVFFVVYTDSVVPEYLILKRKLHWSGWEFPKGGIKDGESEGEAVKRELKEEVGLVPVKVKKFKFSGRYYYDDETKVERGFVGQIFSLYGVSVKKKDVRLNLSEHSDYKWVSFDEAIKKLKWENQRESLMLVDKSLRPRFRVVKLNSGRDVLLGRNSRNNEELVCRVGKNQDVFHTKMSGSPFAVIEGKASKEDVREAGIICAKYSQDWKKNKRDVVVHWFKGKDIFKKKGMKTGTFGVKKFKVIKVKREDILG